MPLYKRCACPDQLRCNHPWWYRFMLNGVNFRASTGETSKRLATNVEAAAREAAEAQNLAPKKSTFAAFAALYLKDHAALYKRDGGVRDEQIITRLNESFGPMALKDITAHDVAKWQATRVKVVSKGTVNRELSTLKHIFTKAIEWRFLRTSPAAGTAILHVDNRRTRILTQDECQRLLRACKGRFQALVALALITGARRGELLNLRWSEVGETELTFLDTKTGKQRRLPMSVAMAGIFATLPRIYDYVFANPRRTGKMKGQPYVSIRKNFERALARAGITTGDVSFHTLRHTALSRMIAQGFDDHTVKEISGHATTRMLERYTHPTQASKAAALDYSVPIFSTISAQTGKAAGSIRRKSQDP